MVNVEGADAPLFLKGRIGSDFSYTSVVGPSQVKGMSSLHIALARVNADQIEEVVLVLAGTLRENPDTVNRELETLLQFRVNEPVNDVVKRVKTWAQARNVGIDAVIPPFSGQTNELSELTQSLAFTEPQNPIDVRDRLTQLRTKSALYSESALRDLGRKIPGNKVMFSFDVRGVGEANKAGLGASGVDALFGELGSMAERAFRSVPFELFRLGGDEFAIIFQDQEPTESANLVDQFTEHFRDRRNELLRETDTRVRSAELRLALRSEMRHLFSTYYGDDCETRMQYIERLLSHFGEGERGQIIEAIQTEEGGSYDSGKLTALLALKRLQARRDSSSSGRVVLDIVGARAHIGDILTTSIVIEALGAIDRETHKLKENPVSRTDGICELDPKIIVRRAERENLSEIAAVDTEYQHKVSQLLAGDSLDIDRMRGIFTQNNLNAIDPEIGVENRVLRLGLIADMPVGYILPFHGEKEFFWFEVKLEPFGPLNNQLGSDRADELFRAMSREMRKLFPTALLVRRNGGNLVVITQESEVELHTAKIEAIIDNTITSASGPRYERAVAEHEQRVALSRVFEAHEHGSFIPDYDEISKHALKIEATHQTLAVHMEFVGPESGKCHLTPMSLRSDETFKTVFERMFPITSAS